jgi:metal-dependent hydrolase (beta-lactamase superfamily II)
MACEPGYTIKVLMNDWVVDAPGELEAEHGLSFYVETPESKFLFDCGHTGAAWRNAEKMCVDLSAVEFVVLSHAHYDHGGGFPFLLEYVKPKVLYTGRNFWQEKFSYDKEKDEYAYKGCGFTKEDLDRWGIEQFECDGTIKGRLDNYAVLFTGFSRYYEFEKIPEKFVRGEDKVPDTFDDEICLLLKEGQGWAMVVGCAHRGILNMVAEVKVRTGKDVVRVVGGIHLIGAGDERIRQTFKELKAMGVQYFNLCHCSTDKCHKSCAWPADLEAFAGGLTIQV